jgi:PAS domain S-box-containing protein
LQADELRLKALRSGWAGGGSVCGPLTLHRIGSGDATVLAATFADLADAEIIAELSAAEAAIAAAPLIDNDPLLTEVIENSQANAGVVAELTVPAVTPGVSLELAQAAPLPLDLESRLLDRKHPLRFVWQMDEEGRFTLDSDEFVALIGAGAAALLGRPWGEMASALELDPEGRVVRALASHDTFSGVTVRWPAEGSALRLPVALSGLPILDASRTFRGYRGFGVCRDVDRIAAVIAERRSRAALEAPEAPSLLGAEQLRDDPELGAFSAELAQDFAPDQRPADVFAPPESRPQLTIVPAIKNVVPFRSPSGPADNRRPALNPVERNAFQEIARALGARLPAEEEAADSVADTPPPLADRAEMPPPGLVAYQAARPAARAAETIVPERAVLDRIPIAVLAYRADKMIYANRTFFDWTGYASLEELAAAGGVEGLFQDPMLADEAEPDAPGRTLALKTRSHATLPVQGRMFTVPWEGETAMLLMLTRAVVDESQRYAELALRSAEAEASELKSILDTATDGIIVVDGEGNVLSGNRSAEALFGYDVHELLGASFTKLFALESHRGALDYLDGLTRNGVASILNDGREVIGRVREGGLIPLYMTMGRISDEPAKFCAVFRDITQWKRAEEELTNAKRQAERASSAKSDFLAKISHEIRTPLNAIIGFSEVMMEERFGPVGTERYRDYLRDIHTSGEHIIALLNDLLDLSKIEAGKLDLTFARVDVNDVVQQCVALMQPQANRERIIIRTSLSLSLPPVVADARSVRQIVLNLLSNSIKFTSAGGQVIVSTALTDAGEAVLRVRDTGVGMSERDIATALEPFRQLPTSSRWGSSGTGLGLPLTKALAEANRARFHIKSTLNAGTLVEIVFPATRVLAE